MKKTILSFLVLACTMMASAATIPVTPGNGTLKTAVASAADGDVLELQTGTYVESSSIDINSAITIRAAADAKPVIGLNKIQLSAPCEFVGLEIYNLGNDYMIRTKANVTGTVLVKDCYMHDSPTAFIYLSGNSVDNLTISGCTFSSNTKGQGGVVYAESAKVTNFSMTNSTAYNISGELAVWLQGCTNAYVDHCTFYNCGTRAVYIKGSTMNSYLVQNCIITCSEVPATNNYCIALYAGDVKNCLYYNLKAPRSGDSNNTGCIDADPKFKDAANADFTLMDGSPALGVATDGRDLGDSKWGTPDTDLSFALTSPKKEELLMGNEYTITWNVNDPAGTNTITLEYATSAEGPWTTINSGIATSTTRYTWSLKGMPAGTYYVRGTLVAAEGNIVSVAEGAIQYIEYIQLSAPAADVEIYELGYTLTWSVNDPSDAATVTLEYATSVSGPWTVIAQNLATTTKQYAWNMAGLTYGTYYVRATLTCSTPVVSVAAGSIQYKEIVPTVYYVSTTGDNGKDGLTWATAKADIQNAVNGARLGDTVKVAAGTYNEYISIHDGVSMYGSYDPATGKQNLNATPTILDGTDLGHFLLVKYDNPCNRETTINGFVLQNAEHSTDGGGAFLRANCILENSIVRNCTTSGSGGGAYNNGGIIRNCTFELCYADGAGGAVRNRGGQLYNCIIRGCQGKYAAVRNEEGAVMYNCVVYNNEPSMDDWPASGGVYNPSGKVYNCTFANNYGAMYAGTHSDDVVYNCVFWNNKSEDGFADPSTYISGSSTANGSGDNAGDSFFEAQNFTLTLNADNMNAAGPNFVAPTNFVGAPHNNGEIAAMRAADFSLLATSPLIDKARNNDAPATDIEGIVRPQKGGVDMGAYEYNPNAPVVVCTGIALNTDTLRIHEESEDALAVIFTPAKTTDRAITWNSANPAIATVNEYGVVTGVAVGSTIITATHTATGKTASAIVVVDEKPVIIIHHEVLEADSLYKIENYTIPSYTPFWVAKEAARADSTDANLQAMREAIKLLVNKHEPYCLVANINGDPKSRMAFNWFTNDGVTDGVVQIVSKANATVSDFETSNGVMTVTATATQTKKLNYAVSTSGLIKATGMDKKTAYFYTSHKALAENLQPGTTYSYRVGFDGHWSDIATFQTAAENQGEYSFVYMSDSHIMNQEYVDNARWCAETMVKNVPEAKFCVFPGDFVETGTKNNSEWEWERWFEESMRPMLYNMPLVPTDGNHDDTELLNYDWHFNTDNAFNKRSLVVKPQFQGIVYSFQYGDVLFLVISMQDYWRESGEESLIEALNSAYLKTDIGNWMREQIQKFPTAKYRVTLCHKNVFSGSGHQEDVETPLFRAMMLPLFKECEIDLAIQGHDHCYEVMGPVVADSIRPIREAISDVQTTTINTNTNMTGLSGGTFSTNDGTLYFIGATCGRKRYYPYTREEMDAQIDKHKVANYYDLFTSRFGQPGAPSFTKFTVKEDGLVLDTYSADDKGVATPFNTIKVVRTREHTVPAGIEEVETQRTDRTECQKYMRNGQLYIVRDGVTYNAFGMKL